MKVHRVLLAGGAGVVGAQVAAMLHRRQPQVQLIVAGRRVQAAEAVARPLGAEALQLDIDGPRFPALAEGTLIVALANDRHDRLLRFALDGGHPYIDVTRWTERLKQALVCVASGPPPRAPVVFASAWMAATAGLMARELVQDLASVERISLDILYALADRAGPNSVEYLDRLSVPFHTLDGGQWQQRQGFSDGQVADFGDAGRHTTYRFDTPDQASLPHLLGAATVEARIAFDDRNATRLLRTLVACGVWKLIAGPRFTPLRRAMLYNPGNGGPHRIRLRAAGTDRQGSPAQRTLLLTDPAGQTHLTALGTVLQIERLLGLEQPPPAPGVYLGENLLDPCQTKAQLQAEGVLISE